MRWLVARSLLAGFSVALFLLLITGLFLLLSSDSGFAQEIAQKVAQELAQDVAPEREGATPGFLDGLTLPFMVSIHLLSLVAVALLVGLHGMGRLTLNTPLFLISLMCGLFITTLYLPDESAGVTASLLSVVQFPVYYAGLILLIITLTSGLLIAIDFKIPLFLVGIFTGLSAYVMGLSSGVMTDSLIATLMTHLGTITSSLFVFLLVGLLGGWINGERAQWVKIGARVAGSWLTAIAILVLSLGFAT